MLKTLYSGFVFLILSSNIGYTSPSLLDAFVNNKLVFTEVSEEQLPSPYRAILTRPLMTNSLKAYYQRTPIINVVHAKQEVAKHTYSRLITMVVDKNKLRNAPQIAQEKDEVISVELAYITMNFNELPTKMIADILHTTIPFGQLLAVHNIKVKTKDRRYFFIRCDERIAPFLHCRLNTILYGRKNTIYQVINQRWLAQVIEILPRMKPSIHSKSLS